jgi:putative ABC transport system permease protein
LGECWQRTQSYVVLPPNVSPASINAALPAFVKKYKPADRLTDGLVLQPLRDIHFDERFGNFNGRTFSRELITALMADWHFPAGYCLC